MDVGADELHLGATRDILRAAIRSGALASNSLRSLHGNHLWWHADAHFFSVPQQFH